MNCVDHIKVEDGKYEIIIGSGNGEFVFKALRYGEEWIPRLELVEGSNMIMMMAYELQDLRHKVEQYENGDLFPVKLLDKDHIEFTYKAVMQAMESGKQQ